MKPYYWITVAAKEHVDIVDQKGYTQVNMGPKEPLEKMHQGDWILYYSPTWYFEQPELCQQFTGISCLTDNHIYPQDINNPTRWRRNAQFIHCIPQHVQQFHHQTEFMHQHENWSDAFEQPVFEIPRKDFVTIAEQLVMPSENIVYLF